MLPLPRRQEINLILISVSRLFALPPLAKEISGSGTNERFPFPKQVTTLRLPSLILASGSLRSPLARAQSGSV